MNSEKNDTLFQIIFGCLVMFLFICVADYFKLGQNSQVIKTIGYLFSFFDAMFILAAIVGIVIGIIVRKAPFAHTSIMIIVLFLSPCASEGLHHDWTWGVHKLWFGTLFAYILTHLWFQQNFIPTSKLYGLIASQSYGIFKWSRAKQRTLNPNRQPSDFDQPPNKYKHGSHHWS